LVEFSSVRLAASTRALPFELRVAEAALERDRVERDRGLCELREFLRLGERLADALVLV